LVRKVHRALIPYRKALEKNFGIQLIYSLSTEIRYCFPLPSPPVKQNLFSYVWAKTKTSTNSGFYINM